MPRGKTSAELLALRRKFGLGEFRKGKVVQSIQAPQQNASPVKPKRKRKAKPAATDWS